MGYVFIDEVDLKDLEDTTESAVEDGSNAAAEIKVRITYSTC